MAAGVYVEVSDTTASVYTPTAPLSFQGAGDSSLFCPCSPFTLFVDAEHIAMTGTYASNEVSFKSVSKLPRVLFESRRGLTWMLPAVHFGSLRTAGSDHVGEWRESPSAKSPFSSA
eukprot:1468053-Rhodomonas_salina.1